MSEANAHAGASQMLQCRHVIVGEDCSELLTAVKRQDGIEAFNPFAQRGITRYRLAMSSLRVELPGNMIRPCRINARSSNVTLPRTQSDKTGGLPYDALGVSRCDVSPPPNRTPKTSQTLEILHAQTLRRCGANVLEHCGRELKLPRSSASHRVPPECF